MDYSVKKFGHYKGQDFDLIEIKHEDVTISFTNLGARINQWCIGSDNLILGVDDPQQAAIGKGYFYGTSVGRIAGRISGGKFSIDGQSYQLPQNEGENHHHGGPNGFDLKYWDYEVVEDADTISIVFSLTDEDGENGFPGRLQAQIIHTYSNNHEWMVTYKATTDKDTLFNPTNHVYFNLNGDHTHSVLNHQLQIDADRYVPVNADGTPIGVLEEVAGTAFDLRQGQLIGDQYNLNNSQIVLKRGFDHPFVLNKDGSDTPIILSAADRRIEVSTDRDAVVVYTHNFVDPPMAIWGSELQQYAGIALETQSIPDAINHPGFGNNILRANEEFESQTVYKLVH